MEGFFIILADAHYFADCAHLRAEFIFDTLEFFKCPAGEFDNDIITPWCIFFECAFSPIWNFIKRKAAASIAETRAMGNPVALEASADDRDVRGIDFDNDYAACFRIMCELYICSADNLNRFDNVI